MDDLYTTDDFLRGVKVDDASITDWLNAVNGRVKLSVPHVAGERVIDVRGAVPAEWSIQ